MSFEAYKIAIKLSLVNRVSAGLVGITSDLKRTDVVAQGLHKHLGLIGTALTGAGVGMLMGLKGPIEAALEYNRELAKMRQMGLGNAQIADAQKFVEANDIIGTSLYQRIKLFTEAQGAFRESGMDGSKALDAAKTMMPVLAQYQVAMGLLGGQHAAAHEGAMRSLNKTVEMMGGLGDTTRATAIADGIFKAGQSSGKMVDERQLKQFVAYGSSATNQLGIRTIFGALEPIIGELGGSTTAVGLRTAYSRTNGMMSLPPRLMLHEMARLNMLDETGRKQTPELAQLQSTDVIGYSRALLRMYQGAGITSQTDRERENAIILGTNGSKVYNKIMAQLPVIDESLKSYDRSNGLVATNKNEAQSPMMAIAKFQRSLEDLGLVIGKTVLPVLTPLINDVTRLVKSLAEHPGLVEKLTFGFVGLAGAMTFSGSLALLTTGFGALGGVLGGLGGAGGLLAAGAASPVVLGILGLSAAIAGMAWLFKLFGPEHRKSDPPLPGVRDPRRSGGEHHEGDEWVPGTGRSGAGGYWRAKPSATPTTSPYVRSSSPMRTVQVHTQINLNNREVGKAVSEHLGKEASRPSAGTPRFDGSMTPVTPGLTGAH
ncbi:hypothetical protein [Rhodoferax sp.]|uniref:hypothetical protein n=1 Tax=Rhodoferax sp. TaxID=50421 RepID=UPI00374D4752